MYSFVKNISNIGKLTALISFIVGSVLLLIFIVDEEAIGILVSFYVVIATILINAMLWAVVIFCAIFFSFQRKELLKTAGIMLLNIPVTIFYMDLIIDFI